jgi:hypothetical protein
MPDYNEFDAAGRGWWRASRIVIENPIPGTGTPAITFCEEEAVPLPSGRYGIATVGNLIEPLIASGDDQNLGESFPLRNPLDGSLLGPSATYAEAQVLLYSLYLHVAGKRDAANASPAPNEE